MSDDNLNALCDLKAESSVLGSILWDNRYIDIHRNDLVPEDFYREQNRILWRAFSEAQGPIDPVTMKTALEATGEFKASGESAYLAQLMNETPVALNVSRYIEIVKDASVARGISDACRATFDDIQSGWRTGDAREALADRCQAKLSKAIQPYLRRNGRNRGLETIGETALRLFDEADKRSRSGPATIQPRVTTGFRSLDAVARIPVGVLSVLAARPRIGKTAMAATMLRIFATLGMKPHLCNLEDNDDQLMIRIASAVSGVNTTEVERLLYQGPVDQRDNDNLSKVASALLEISKLDATWDDTSGLTVEGVRMQCRERVKAGAGFILIDHALKIRLPQQGRDTREKVNHIIGELADMASELQVPTLVLTQLNRDAEGKLPTLRDLKESGKWEEDARLILFLHRDLEHAQEGTQKGIVKVAKQSHGRGDDVVILAYDPHLCRWRDPDRSAFEGPF